MRGFEAQMAAGMRLQSERAWRRAASAFEEAARGRRGPGAAQAWRLAGECWRRDDALAKAEAAFRRALGSGPDAQDALLARIAAAAVCAERGDGAGARALGESALAEAEATGGFALAADTHLNHLLADLELEEARVLAEVLVARGGPEAVAGRFRLAQIARLDARFDEAEATLRAVIGALEGRREAVSGVAAATAELGEVALMSGRPAEAVGWFSEAWRLAGEAERESLRWRAEAARVRGLAEAGVAVLADPLAEGLRFAKERGMPGLAVDLWLAMGEARLAVDPAAADACFTSARAGAQGVGGRSRRGRAAYGLARVREGVEREAALSAARQELAPSAAWLRRLAAVGDATVPRG